MKILSKIKSEEKKYRFECPYCKTKLEAEESELMPLGAEYRFVCPVCKCNRYTSYGQVTEVKGK